MRVLVAGSGGREHALLWRLSREPGATALFCAPGNAGIAAVAERVDIDSGDPDSLLAFAERAAIDHRQFGAAGARLVIEECLVGPEVSFFALCDGTRAIPIASAQDHKRIFDGDRGPNTGGMGAFSPSPLMDASTEAVVMRDIVD